MKTNMRFRPAAGQSGVVLLEALLAVFIFSIGILGLVGMLAASVKNVSEAQYRMEAAFLVDSLIAEIRVADRSERTTTYASPSGASFSAWKTRVTSGASSLPGAAISTNAPTVVFSGTGNRDLTITVKWQAKNDNTTRQYIAITALE